MLTESQTLINNVQLWGYSLMLMAMILEGPVATLTAAFLSSMGFFNIFIVYFLSVLGDVIGDILLYTIGYFGGRKVFLKIEKFLKIKESVVVKLENKFEKHGAKIIFFVKSTTGLSWIAFVLAGTVKMSFYKFLNFSILGGLIWSAFLVITGYFFGQAAENINQYIKYAGIIIFIGALLFFAIISFYKKRQTEKFLKEKF